MHLQNSPKLHNESLCGSIGCEVFALPQQESLAAPPGNIAGACITGSALVPSNKSQCEARPSQSRRLRFDQCAMPRCQVTAYTCSTGR